MDIAEVLAVAGILAIVAGFACMNVYFQRIRVSPAIRRYEPAGCARRDGGRSQASYCSSSA